MRMKSYGRFSRAGIFPVLATVLLASATTLPAQTTEPQIPVVFIQATTPVATSPTNPGVFTVFRSGDTNSALNVYCRIGGTASNGVDYALISNFIPIPAGATSNTVAITPAANFPPTAVKSVVLQLAPSPLMTPVNYIIFYQNTDAVYIRGSGLTNIPPVVTLWEPTNGTEFVDPTDILMEASTFDQGGIITNVEFFAGTNDLGKGQLVALNAPADPVPFGGTFWRFDWTNAPAGSFALTAVAADNLGFSGASAVANITVTRNLPPTVQIVSPQQGAVFYSPPDISILAQAAGSEGPVTNVEFFAGANDLGKGQLIVSMVITNGVGGGPVWYLDWTNPPLGAVALTAVATDGGGASTTSAPVDITNLPPLTNLPPVVRIIGPADGSVFRAPVNIPISAYASDPDGSVPTVEFFNGSNSIGFGQNYIFPQPPPPGQVGPDYVIYEPNLFFLEWTNAPIGTNALTAVATENSGASTTSAVVQVTILPPLPPPTNLPVVVSIVATDPIAIEGTNSWVWPAETNSPATWSGWPPSVWRFVTNTGPKSAMFTVRRHGSTNNDVTVAYAIGGTASNGVDYATLSGLVTVPAGQRSAMITITPIDDGPPDITSSVVLSLEPSTNTPPAYVVGYPHRAEAIILDPGSVTPVSGFLADRSFHFAASGPDAAWFSIQYSTNLLNWTAVCTNQVVNGSIDFVDPDAPNNVTGFYRAVPLASGPSD
jgi:hypothetical protein